MAVAGRSYPIRAHVARPIVAPGGPVSVVAQSTQVSQALRSVSRVMRRPTIRPHLARPIVGAATGPAPMQRGTFVRTAVSSARRPRPLPKPHTSWPSYSDMGSVLRDDFTGSSIDAAKWDVYDRLGDQVNNEVNAVIPANVRVSGDLLSIDQKFETVSAGDTTTSAPNPRNVDYTSGQVAEHAESFLYGSVRVRAKIPGGTGNWPCIWMLGYQWQLSQPYTANVVGHDWPNGGWWEADIAEFMFDHRTLVNNALHFITANRGGSGEKSLPFDATTRFMVYRLDWSPTAMTWYVDAEDGNGWVQTLQITGTAGVDIPDTPGYVIIHTAIGGNAANTPDSATFPTVMTVDYVDIKRTADTVVYPTTWPTGTPVAPAKIVSAVARARRPLTIRPHLARPIVAPGGPYIAGRTAVDQTVQRALVGRRGAPRPHLAPPNLTQPIPTTPVARGTFVTNTTHVENRRPAPRPHVARGVVAPGGPVVPGRTHVGQQAKARALQGRTCPRPHTAAPVPFTPAGPPLSTGLVVGQAHQRTQLGRATPRPHVARPNLQPQPFPPAKVLGQARPRALVGRTVPRPHLAPEDLTPPTVVIGQATLALLRTDPRAVAVRTDTRIDAIGSEL